ncbi:MAG: hypothetical protein V1787_04145 [Candidatus Micrarchaeota archaeon]
MVSVAAGFDLLGALTLVLSILVLLYLANYALLLLSQKRTGKVRWDWNVSMIFYAGIGLVALSYLFRRLILCSGLLCPESWTDLMIFLSMLLFLWGFKKRADTSESIEVSVLEYADIKRKRRQKKG